MAYRLMNEYSVDWPFWDDGLCDDGDPELPERLAAEVREWAATFNGHYSWKTGWDDRGRAAGHRRQAERLLSALRLELGDDAVHLHYWETNGA